MVMMWETNYVENFPSTYSLQSLSHSLSLVLSLCLWVASLIVDSEAAL